MKFYHATTVENMKKILKDGVIKGSFGGEVFLCKKPMDACKFLVIRGIRRMCVIEVDLKEKVVLESCDHSEAFFQCKAYVHNGNVELSGVEEIEEYEFNF